MNIIEKMLSGEMPMREFIKLYKTDEELRSSIRKLIPDDAKNNPNHSFWESPDEYNVYDRYDCDLCKMIDYPYGRYLNGRIGTNLNLHWLISRLYKKTHPNFPSTEKYEKMFRLYLSAVNEAYEGDDEIQMLLEKIILSASSASPKKSEQKRIAKEAIMKAFHVEDAKKYPRWIQGGEWPMGKNSPMVYVRRENHGEEVHYFFRDFDTGEERTVIQFY